MNIRETALQLNDLSINYDVGRLQDIRKEIKGLARRPHNSIFHEKTISNQGWAFHYGGRTELQYNIGVEEEGLRYGLAFSLEPSQSLPEVSVLYPKIFKLNCLIREQPDLFRSIQMWHWQKDKRSDIHRIQEINEELVSPNTFIFFGNICRYDDIDLNTILRKFDDLLPIYVQIETDSQGFTAADENETFKFENKSTSLPNNRSYTTKEHDINIDIRHSALQQKLISELREEFGAENVSVENPIGRSKIDVVVRNGQLYTFYEVKVASSLKNCMRQAFGQLMEYAYWNGKANANKMVIAGEYELETEAKAYLNYLNNNFHIPIEYRQISLD